MRNENLITELILLDLCWVEDISENLCYEDTQFKTKYLKYDKYHIQIREINNEIKYTLMQKIPIDFGGNAAFQQQIIKELKYVDRFKSLFYELTNIHLIEIPFEGVLVVVKINDFENSNVYQQVDYRELSLSSLYRFVCGVTGSHDYILFNKRRETYMSFCSDSPFGKEIFKKYVETYKD